MEKKIRINSTCKLSVKKQMRCHPKKYYFHVLSFLQRWKGIIRNIYNPASKGLLDTSANSA